jgi:hypothetical protein
MDWEQDKEGTTQRRQQNTKVDLERMPLARFDQNINKTLEITTQIGKAVSGSDIGLKFPQPVQTSGDSLHTHYLFLCRVVGGAR